MHGIGYHCPLVIIMGYFLERCNLNYLVYRAFVSLQNKLGDEFKWNNVLNV
jgi:hypothetical protein